MNKKKLLVICISLTVLVGGMISIMPMFKTEVYEFESELFNLETLNEYEREVNEMYNEIVSNRISYGNGRNNAIINMKENIVQLRDAMEVGDVETFEKCRDYFVDNYNSIYEEDEGIYVDEDIYDESYISE